jgi:large subunit ribosomal protein L18
MSRTTAYRLPKRRKREGKTNYRKRLKLLLSHKPRLIVRKSNNNIVFQISEYQPEGDKTILSANSKELKAFGYKGHGGNAKSGYLVGYLGGVKAVKAGVKNAILDIGMVSPVKGSTSFAVLLGALEAGLIIPNSGEILPQKDKFSDLEAIKKKISGA